MSLQKSVKSAGGDRSEQGDTTSICSSVTTQPDRHGFFGGAQYSPEPKRTVSPSTILKREQKWLRMLNNWEAFMSKNYKKVRERCRKGIPASVRPKAWLYLCGGQLLLEKHPNEYEELLQAPGDPKCMEDIRKDLHRQFPYHEMFIREEGLGILLLLALRETWAMEIKLESLDNGPGLLPYKLGQTRMTTHHHTFLQYIDLRNIERQITTLQNQVLEYKNLLSNDTYTLFEIQIHYLTDKIGKVSNQLKSLEPDRVKRGLVDSLGSIIKSITGSLDYTDALKYETAFKNLQFNNDKLINEFNNHVSLSKEWMTKHNSVLVQLVQNQVKINNTLELLLNNTFTNGSLIKYTKFGQLLSIISENVEDLRLELTRVENMLAFIRASSTIHSMIDVDTLKSMIDRLEKIYSKDEILSLELREYYDVIQPGSYFNEKRIVIVFRFPIVSKRIFDLYRLSIVPNKHHQALIPTYPFIATNKESFVYIEAECSKYNNWYLCEKEITHQIRTKTDCIQELIINQALGSSCQFTTVFLEKEAMEKLDDQHYILSFPDPTQVQLVCGREDYNSLQGSYLVILPVNCYLRTKEITIINDNDEIQGQPLKLMNIPYNLEKQNAASTRVHLNSIDLEGLRSIQRQVMMSQPVQPTQLQSNIIYHTTLPFYTLLLIVIIITIAILCYRYKLFNKGSATYDTKGHKYEEPDRKEEDQLPREQIPATFSLNVLK